jgi:GR25 family glycosyltransferase involved in LPS biosynthesis
MIFNTIFNNIYVINLKKSIDRKKHIEYEFKRVGIEKYEFFDATNHDSDEVINIMNSGLVKTFPNCFRCGLNRCDCENNYLTPFQIGNWCSFINVFKDILKNKYDFVLICEDDVVFSFQYERIINKLLSKQSFKKYNINMNKPLLIRMGTAFREENHNSNAEPIFLKNYALCNPCFAINKEMAFIYLKYLKIIDYHSDVYFHQKIPKNIKDVQSFTMFPYPVYELSFVKSKQKFISEVRPQNGIRRIEYKEFLFITSNVLLQVFLKKLINYTNFDIKIDKMGYNGNIDYFLFFSDYDKKKYFFQNKILIYDSDIEFNKKIINKFINNPLYKCYNNKFSNDNNINNDIININDNNDINDINDVININDTFYNNLIKFQNNFINKENNFIKINIKDINNIHNIFPYINISKINNLMNEYNNIKNNLLKIII